MKCTILLLDCLRENLSNKIYKESTIKNLETNLNKIYSNEEFVIYSHLPILVKEGSKIKIQKILDSYYEDSLEVIKKEAFIMPESGCSCIHY